MQSYDDQRHMGERCGGARSGIVPREPPAKRGCGRGEDVTLPHDGHRHMAGRKRVRGSAHAVQAGDRTVSFSSTVHGRRGEME